MLSKISALAAAALLIAATGFANAQTKTETVQFPKGATGTVIKGTIKGDEAVDYVVDVAAGQQMTVDLKPSNLSTYFNITAPGADAAMFIGSTEGTTADVTIPSSGDYRITVFLMRNAARRNETSDYTLSIDVVGAADAPNTETAAPAVGTPVPEDMMVKFCVGEVAGMYDVRPVYVTPGELMRADDGSATIDGTVDKGDEGVKAFQCRYDAQNVFIDVMAMTSDGE